MASQDDSDVKIFSTANNQTDTGELIELSSQLDKLRRNGSISKAKALGDRLAVLEPTISSGVDFSQFLAGADISGSDIFQIRVLLIFLAQTTLHKMLGTQLLSSCAVNALYDKLMATYPDFYEKISDGAAFTFYYLSLHGEKDTAVGIGETFAMLCGKDSAEDYCTLGAKIYAYATAVIENIIKEYRFKLADS